MSAGGILVEDKIVFPTVRWITYFCRPQLKKSRHLKSVPVFASFIVFAYKWAIGYEQ
jgi:hypothetical protein